MQTNRISYQEDQSIPVSRSELDHEFEKGQQMLHKELEMVLKAKGKKLRRKIPKAGCYPSEFSEFTMKRVSCTISLSELRKDLSALSTPSDEELQAQQETEKADIRVTKQSRLSMCVGRNCRRVTREDCRPPRSAAEEKRQLQQALRQSLQAHPCVPLVTTASLDSAPPFETCHRLSQTSC